MVIKLDVVMGNSIRSMIFISLAPSSFAHSMISSGTCMKPCRKRKIPKAFEAKGRICGHRVLISPQSDMVR